MGKSFEASIIIPSVVAKDPQFGLGESSEPVVITLDGSLMSSTVRFVGSMFKHLRSFLQAF